MTSSEGSYLSPEVPQPDCKSCTHDQLYFHRAAERQNDSQQGQLEENNNRFISVDEDSSGNQEEPEEDEEHAGEQDEEDEEEEEMDQESDDFDQSDDSSREDEHTHSNSVTNSSSIVDLPIHQLSSPFYTKTTKVSIFVCCALETFCISILIVIKLFSQSLYYCKIIRYVIKSELIFVLQGY